MADMMTFPATVEEFMEQYKMTDTEHVYSNGTEYVPIYRMKQWFEHVAAVDAVHVVRCRDCAEDGRFTCPLAYIENNTLCFVDHSPDFFCAAGERKEGAD